jgi:predicted N-formylglutamate amidohydrolase
MNPACAEEAWAGLGAPKVGGVLIVADHASSYIPIDVALDLAPEALQTHIACDFGVAEVARLLVERGDADTALLGGVSRLVIDLNRELAAPGLIPTASDGWEIPGNILNSEQKAERIARFYTPYHDKLAEICQMARPAMILSLHSFTPNLQSRAEDRPWEIGVLYNQDDRLARIAITLLEAAGLITGDQRPYSGKDLNYTMNRHAEGNAIPYLGLEMRQDKVADANGQGLYADIICHIIEKCRNYLA